MSLLVRAGAGTGKTSVLVERFARAVIEDGVAVDAILAITFTEKAASEMKARVRARLVELGRRDEARRAEGAWISTIHRFCARLLRAHALSAGIDPEYRVLDELESQRLSLDAFDRALEELLAESAGTDRLELVAAYTPDRLRDMVRTAYSNLRSRGQRRPRLAALVEPSDGMAEVARLSVAVEGAASDLASAEPIKQVTQALERLEGCREALEGPVSEAALLDRFKLTGSANALKSDPCEEYRQALDGYRGVVLARSERRHHALLRVLLELYGGALEDLKSERSGLDFEDLQLIARDLLVGDDAIRQGYAERFAHVMVDEFQDVNPLQNELLGLLERGNQSSERCSAGQRPACAPTLFRVGDEKQSIYGFRHADVGVFARHHAEARREGRAQSVTTNFRSRREVLDVVDLAFERTWGEDFEPLRAGRSDPPCSDPCVELLAVDRKHGCWDELDEDAFGRSLRAAPRWRAAEARLLARRLEQLAQETGHGWGDIVVLMRATTHMTFYERALEESGIPTHVVGGRGYWSQQQVGDLRHWLAALANPLDELSLLSVLASPLVGVSLDAVTLVGVRAERAGRDPWWALQAAFAGDDPGNLLADLPGPDRDRLERFVVAFARERADAPRVSLERLIDRAVTTTGYDRHILARPAGDRRMANVRKLMRMAREFEADEGRDLRSFIDFVAERDLISGREGEAPLEAAELQRVRLMTIHRAKGLEFPVVFVADLGKDGHEDHGPLRLSEDGRLGLRLSSLGAAAVPTAELERIKAEQRVRDEAEERRILYVALTRARERLVLSGATDLRGRPEPKPLSEPLRWLWRALVPGLPHDEAGGVHTDSWQGRDVAIRWERLDSANLDEHLPLADRVPTRPAPEPGAPLDPLSLELGVLAAPRALPVSRLSYSGLEAYRRCGYRFYLDRALRLPGADELGHDGSLPPQLERPRDEAQVEGLPALLRGSLVHELLEHLDLRRPVTPSAREVARLLEREGVEVREEDVADLRDMVERFAGSSLRRRLAAARRTRAELPFAFTLVPPRAGGRSVLVNGFVDMYAAEDDRTLIVDYKSDRLGPEEHPSSLAEDHYATQRVVYALAALREGAARAEVVHVFLERPDEPASVVWEAADAPELERRLLSLAAGVVEGRFEPTDEPHRELCVGCPGQPALCSWPPEQTLA